MLVQSMQSTRTRSMQSTRNLSIYNLSIYLSDCLYLLFTIYNIFVVFVNMFAMLHYYYVVGGGLNLMLIELVAQPHCT